MTKQNAAYLDMSEEKYFSLKYASNSTLNRMNPTPAHCKQYMEQSGDKTAAMIFGSLVHTVVLEPDQFGFKYAIKPEGIDRRTKQGKADYAAFLDASAGKEVITEWDYFVAKQMAASVRGHLSAGPMIENGKAETSLVWHDEEFDIQCKSRLDFMADDGYINDLKTTDDASPAGFARSIVKYNYHRQHAMYCDGYEAVFGKPPKGFRFIVVEKKPPYLCAVYELEPESVEIGRFEYRQLLGQFAQCVRDDYWPGYSVGIEPLSLPGWKLAQYENDIVEDIV